MDRNLCVSFVWMAALAAAIPLNSLHGQTLVSPSRPTIVQSIDREGKSTSRLVAVPPVTPSLFVGPGQSNLRTFVSPGSIVVAPPEPATLQTELYDERFGEPPVFPLRINSVTLGGRVAVLADSTRLNKDAGELFLPSAIPVRGESNFGNGFRTNMSGSKSSVGLSWLSELANQSAVSGGVRLDFDTLTTDEVRIAAPQAWVGWERILIGVADSLFTDVACNPDTIEVNGPNGRPYLENGHAQLRFTFLQPGAYSVDPTGYYGALSIESPKVGVLAPMNYAGFGRYPDLVAALNYQQGQWLRPLCGKADAKPTVYDEDFHIQVGGLVRDLGVENTTDTVRENATGWGLQLSARCAVFRRQCGCDWLSDFVFGSVTGGDGIGGYFTDLAKISNVNDAAFDSVADILEPLPVLAFFVGYQHQWTALLRSTIVYSRIDLDSQRVPKVPVIPYDRGQYASANLMYNLNLCDKKEPKLHSFFAGVEYLFGDRVNVDGDSGDAHRLMFVLAATN